MAAKRETKRLLDEDAIRDIEHFNAVPIQLTDQELLTIYNAIVAAGKEESRQEDKERVRLSLKPEETKKALKERRKQQSSFDLACCAFQSGRPERWAIKAISNIVDDMFDVPPAYPMDDRQQLNRKLAKVILNSFDRCINWTTIDRMTKGNEDVLMTGIEDNMERHVEQRPSKHAVDPLRLVDGEGPPKPRHSRHTSRTDAHIQDQTIDAFAKQNKGKAPAYPVLPGAFDAGSRAWEEQGSRHDDSITAPGRSNKPSKKKSKSKVKKESNEEEA